MNDLVYAKKIIEKLKEACSNCDDHSEEGLCRDIPLDRKIMIGCGKWKSEELMIDEKRFYKIINDLVGLNQVIQDLLKKEE